jgi:hypothetical protein
MLFSKNIVVKLGKITSKTLQCRPRLNGQWTHKNKWLIWSRLFLYWQSYALHSVFAKRLNVEWDSTKLTLISKLKKKKSLGRLNQDLS